mmetsp:Transcript_71596/g.142061  ORF Transcript_71596/g.142061 Transcript_71596/m.142061 type:complete len:559 (+) Transcript_71596:87-1763(+)
MSWRSNNQGSSDRGCSRDDSQDSRWSGSARSGASKAETELRRENAELQDHVDHMQEELETLKQLLNAANKQDNPNRRFSSKKRRGDASSDSDDDKRTRTNKNTHRLRLAVSNHGLQAREQLDFTKQQEARCLEEMYELQSELQTAEREQDSSKKRISDLEKQRHFHQMDLQAAQEETQTEARVSAKLQEELQEFRKIREETSRAHPFHFDPGHHSGGGLSHHVGHLPPPDNTDANSLAAELENHYDSAEEIPDSTLEEVQHKRSGETMNLVKHLKSELDEALKSKEASIAEVRAEAAEKEEELRRSLAESTSSWNQAKASLSSISTSSSGTSDRSSRSTRDSTLSIGSDPGLARKERRPRTFNTTTTYRTINPRAVVARAASMAVDGPRVPTDPKELRDSYVRLLEEAESLRTERDKAQQERQELTSERHELEEAVEESRRWKVFDALQQTAQVTTDMIILGVAGTTDLEPIREDEEPSSPNSVQPSARRAWSVDGTNSTNRASTRENLRKRVSSQRKGRSRDGLRSNAAYQNVRLMKKVVDVIDTPHVSEEGGGTAE